MSLGGVVTLGVFNVIFGAVGLAIPALFWLGWRLDEGAPGGTDWFLVLAAASAAHQVVLVLGGIGLILTRRWGRIISLFWAGLSAAAVLVVVAMALLGSATDLGALGQAAALGIAGVLVIYPVLLLFLLNIPSYRAALGLRTPPLDCVRVDGDSLREHLREPAEARR